jgi:hypothetical protein
LKRVTHGHFLSESSEDAALSMEGCEPHSENFAGTILLSRHDHRWVMDWYKQGLVTDQCHKIRLDSGREILACMGQFGAQGFARTELYIADLLSPTGSLMAGGGGEFFHVSDTTGTCGSDLMNNANVDRITRTVIDRVEFRGVLLSVTAEFGQKQGTLEEVQRCIGEMNAGGFRAPPKFWPPTKTYRIDFVFDGKTYRVAPASAGSARIFAAR